MSALRRFAQKVRHSPGLERAEGFWRLLRKPYHSLLNAGGRGVKVMVGKNACVRMPADFAGGSWEAHEPEAVSAFSQWISSHPDALVLDIGSSIGIFSAVALFASERCRVIAFDSDLPSIAATRRMCQHAKGERLRVVYGFLAERGTAAGNLSEALAATEERLSKSRVTGEVGTTRYVCLTDDVDHAVPTQSLDALLAGATGETVPLLIKCDVEGAELLVLQGASQLLAERRPTLLLSIHPQALPEYGHSKQAVEAFLQQQGYDVRLLAVDHEEHWWCECLN